MVNIIGTHYDDEEIDDLLWIALNVQDERICDARRRRENNHDL